MAGAPRRPRILIAGVGNVLRGDDGFGVAAAWRLMARDDLPQGVKVIETGIGGMSLVQELMSGYDALILLDACRCGDTPGRLYLIEPDVPNAAGFDPDTRREYFADTHYATPIRALALLRAVAQLPAVIRIVGCEPDRVDEFRLGLSAPVEGALSEAASLVMQLIDEFHV
jgi:hydrogenase maturation protease